MPEVSLEEVQDLLRSRIAAVLAVDEPVDLDARLHEDLHADSLDLVELVEGVERRLASRGVQVSLADDELLAVRTVREAAERIHAAAAPGRDGA